MCGMAQTTISQTWKEADFRISFGKMRSHPIEMAYLTLGNLPALAFAAGHPKRVSHLVVMNSLVIWDEKTSWEINLLRRFGWNRVLLERLPRAVFFRAIRTFLPRSYRLPQALRGDLWECFQQREVRHFVVRLCAGYQGSLPKLQQ